MPLDPETKARLGRLIEWTPEDQARLAGELAAKPPSEPKRSPEWVDADTTRALLESEKPKELDLKGVPDGKPISSKA